VHTLSIRICRAPFGHMDRLSQVLGLGQDSLLGQLAQQAESARPANGRVPEVRAPSTPSPPGPRIGAMSVEQGPPAHRGSGVLRAGRHAGTRWRSSARPTVPAGPARATQPAGQPPSCSIVAAVPSHRTFTCWRLRVRRQDHTACSAASCTLRELDERPPYSSLTFEGASRSWSRQHRIALLRMLNAVIC